MAPPITIDIAKAVLNIAVLNIAFTPNCCRDEAPTPSCRFGSEP
jgi:hypothetical protein